jgi:hypothetical protein
MGCKTNAGLYNYQEGITKMSPGLIAAIAAVMVDSVVTLVVGYRLQHTAKREIAKGVQDVIDNAPALMMQAMVNAASNAQEVEQNG